MSEDERAGQHHRYNEHELGQTSGDGEGQRGLACCSPRGGQESDPTKQLKKNNNNSLSYKALFKGVHLFYISDYAIIGTEPMRSLYVDNLGNVFK